MGLNDAHLLQGQGQHPFPAYTQKLFVGNIQVDLADLRPAFTGNLRDKRSNPSLSAESSVIQHLKALDKRIAEESGGDPSLHRACYHPREEVLHRGVDPFSRREGTTGNILDCLPGRAPHIIGDAGTETTSPENRIFLPPADQLHNSG